MPGVSKYIGKIDSPIRQDGIDEIDALIALVKLEQQLKANSPTLLGVTNRARATRGERQLEVQGLMVGYKPQKGKRSHGKVEAAGIGTAG